VLPLLAVGCTDDVVCPEPNGSADGPYISARVSERVDEDGGATSVTVFCAGDPVPSLFVVYVGDTELPEAVPADEPGLVTTLDEAGLLCEPGTRCSLKVTTNYGFAGAGTDVPSAFAVDAPETIVLGETLPLTWHPSEGADYYVVTFLLTGPVDTVAVSEIVADTMVTFGTSVLTTAGELVGQVEAVAGPIPDVGAQGNISGAGWGFFAVAYHDTMSLLRIAVEARGGS
jgi:hypothetical protein